MKKLRSILLILLSCMILIQAMPIYAMEESERINSGVEVEKKVSSKTTIGDKILTDFINKNSFTVNADEKAVFIIEFEPGRGAEVKSQLKKIESLVINYEYDSIFEGCSVSVKLGDSDKLFDIEGIKAVQRAERIEPHMKNARELSNIEKAIIEHPDYSSKYEGFGIDGSGMVIATVDSGVNINHPAMSLDEGVFENKAKIKNVDPGYSEKIPHGFNYYHGSNDLKEYAKANHSHGMHIAGILAGNDKTTGFKGVAPNAQLLVYKVYDTPEDESKKLGVHDDVVFDAMDDAIKHGADVISLSIGDFGNGLPDDIYSRAVKNAAEHGVIIVAAMGNASNSASNNKDDDYSNKEWDLKDTGIAVSVAANPKVIAAASMRNTKMYVPTISLDEKEYSYSKFGNYFKEILAEFKNEAPYTSGEIEIVWLDYAMDENIPDLKGKVVLMMRGREGVKEKFDRVFRKGAIGAILINSVTTNSRDTYDKSLIINEYGIDLDHWAINITGNDGKEILKKFGDSPKVGDTQKFKIKFNDEAKPFELKDVEIPSAFTGWGPTIDLRLKPDVIAPGQPILSTYNENYGMMSGTSMSSPFIAGSSALIMPKARSITGGKEISNNIDGIDASELTKILLMNTAKPLISVVVPGLEFSPRQQGAGKIDIDAALSSDVILTHKKEGSVSLGEIKSDSVSFKLNVQNFSDSPKEFKIRAGKLLGEQTIAVQKEDEYDNNKTHTVNEVHPKEVSANITTPETIKIAGKGKASFTVSISGIQADEEFVEGYIYLEPVGEGTELSIPYMGFKGDWTKEAIMDAPSWTPESKTKMNSMFAVLEKDHHHRFLELTTAIEIEVDEVGVIHDEETEDYGVKPLPNVPTRGKIDPENFAVSASKDKAHSTIQFVRPRMIALRDNVDYDISIVKKGETSAQDKIIKVFRHAKKYPKFRNAYYNGRKWYTDMADMPDPGLEWDGKYFAPHLEKGEYGFESKDYKTENGQYYYRFRFRNREDAQYQHTYMPIKVDSEHPTIELVSKDITKGELIAKVTDNNGIWHIGASLNGLSEELSKLKVDKISTEEQNGKKVSQYKISGIPSKNEDNLTTKQITVAAMDFAGNPAYFLKEGKTITNGQTNVRHLTVDFNESYYSFGNLSEFFLLANTNDLNIKAKENVKKVKAYVKNGDTKTEVKNILDRGDGDYLIEFEKRNSENQEGIPFGKTIVIEVYSSEEATEDTLLQQDELKVPKKEILNNEKHTPESPIVSKYEEERLNKIAKDKLSRNEYIRLSGHHYKTRVAEFIERSAGNLGADGLKSGDDYWIYGDEKTPKGKIDVRLLVNKIKDGTTIEIRNFNFYPDAFNEAAEKFPYKSTPWKSKDGSTVLYTINRIPRDQIRYDGLFNIKDENIQGYLGGKSYWIPIVNGENVINIRAYHPEHDGGKTPVFEESLLYIMDQGTPTFSIDKNITSVDDSGEKLIYTNRDDFVKIRGNIWDHSESWHLEINQQALDSFYLYGEPGKSINERSFDIDFPIDDTLTHITIASVDKLNLGRVPVRYEIVRDKEAPTIDLSFEDGVPKFEIDDNGAIATQIIEINGQEYEENKPLSEYGKGQIIIKAVVTDKAGNVTALKWTVPENGNVENLKAQKSEKFGVKLKKDKFTPEEVKDVNNIFELPDGVKVDFDVNTLDGKLGTTFIHPIFIKENEREHAEFTITIRDKIIEEENIKALRDPSLDVKLKKNVFLLSELKSVENIIEADKDLTYVVLEKLDLTKSGKKSLKLMLFKDGKFNEVTKEFEIAPELSAELKGKNFYIEDLYDINKVVDAKGANVKLLTPISSLTSGENLILVELSVQYSQVKQQQFTINILQKQSIDSEREKNSGSSISFSALKPPKAVVATVPVKKVEEPIKASDNTKSGYIKGYPDGTFKPENTISRAEVATLIARLLKVESANANFSDVKGHWAETSIGAIAKKGMIKGYEDGTYKPDAKITRAEFVAMISTLLKAENSDKTFKDTKGHWAEKIIAKAAKEGIVTGYEDGSFKPQSEITRAEAVTILNRLFKIKNATGEVDFKDVPTSHWAYKEISAATSNSL